MANPLRTLGARLRARLRALAAVDRPLLAFRASTVLLFLLLTASVAAAMGGATRASAGLAATAALVAAGTVASGWALVRRERTSRAHSETALKTALETLAGALGSVGKGAERVRVLEAESGRLRKELEAEAAGARDLRQGLESALAMAQAEAKAAAASSAETAGTLKRSLARFAALMDLLSDGVLMEDSQRRLLASNPAFWRLLGQARPAPDGAAAAALVARLTLDPEAFLRRNAELMAGAAAVRGESWELADGNVWERDYAPIPLEGGGRAHLWVYRDVTDRRREVERGTAAVRELAALQADFIAGLSRALRGPARKAVNAAERLLPAEVSAHRREELERARGAGETLLALLGDLLDYSKIGSGRLALESVDFDAGEAVEQALQLCAKEASEKGVALVADSPPELVPVRGDPGRFRRVVAALAADALRGVGGGRVVATLAVSSARDGRLRVRVTVTGGTAVTGGDDALVPSGDGMALWVARRLAAMMGGGVGEEAGGRTFDSVLAAGAAADPALPAGGVRRVLLVDADDASRRALAARLSAWGCDVLACAGTEEALEAAARAAAGGSGPDVALIDAPDGPALARALRRVEGLVELRVALAALRPTALDPVELEEAGIGALLAKPVSRSPLAAFLNQPARPERSEVATAPASRRPVRVLVVSDDPGDRHWVVGRLDALGYAADVAADWEEALESAGEVPYGLVLLDGRLPQGPKAGEVLRLLGAGRPRLPVLALVPGASEEDRRRFLSAGLDDVLATPLNEEDLRKALLRWDRPLDEESPAGETGGGPIRGEAAGMFLREGAQRMLALVEAVGRGDPARAAATAGAIRLLSVELGARGVWSLASRIESAAALGSVADAETLIGSLLEEFERVRQALSAG